MDRAEQMREAARREAIRLAHDGDHSVARAIAALPLPPQPALDAEAAEMVECLRDALLGASAQTCVRAADLIERLAGERDRQYDENVNRIAKEAAAEARAENAEAAAEDMAELQTALNREANEQRARAEKAEAEVARLRKALIGAGGQLKWASEFLPSQQARVVSDWSDAATISALKGTDHG